MELKGVHFDLLFLAQHWSTHSFFFFEISTQTISWTTCNFSYICNLQAGSSVS